MIKTAFAAGCCCCPLLLPAQGIDAISLSKKPEPAKWYTGDIHVHRNCGDGAIVPYDSLALMMESEDLSVISVLADMGNGEVKDSKVDLLNVTGKDAPQSRPGRIIRWDAEWHWDATYSIFEHQALGGHLVLLGLKEARQIWEESPYKILNWAKAQQAVTGICHFQYLNDQIQNELNCCIPIDYPVEAALGTVDFISEDVYAANSPNNGNYNSEAAMNAYYKLLNCGFRLGLAAGTDFPCNNREPAGSLLTYVKVKDELSYDKWIQGIKNGRTVVSRNGHNEFLDLKVDGKYEPGDEIRSRRKKNLSVQVTWTATERLSGTIELVHNGQVMATEKANAGSGSPAILTTNVPIDQSGWLCARRMDAKGHQTHTAPVYITIDRKPVRASSADAQFFANWIDNILEKIAPGGPWSRYFSKDQEIVQQRYIKARDLYRQIAVEAQTLQK